jgi:hypothetical protein
VSLLSATAKQDYAQKHCKTLHKGKYQTMCSLNC